VARTIFRESAVEAYRRRAQRDVVPRLVSTPIMVCSWLLLGALLAAAVLAWSVRVPAYVDATGVILARPAAAVVFVPPGRTAEIRAGQTARVRIGSDATSVPSVVAQVRRGLIGPDAARRRYGLAGTTELTEPSTSVLIRLRRSLSTTAYGGSRVTARLETGSQRLAALIPGLGGLFGGGDG
jgi:hypothetical protein